jgi:glycosyltransferase involved in cell wall biosynthesis
MGIPEPPAAMRVSIAIPTYNRAEELRRTLRGLARVDACAGEDYEVLVVGNRCTDHTAAVAAEMAPAFGGRFRYVEEEMQGLSHARNRALAESRFEVIAFLDDDVEVDPNWLGALVAAYRAEDCAAVGGRAYLVYPRPRPRWLGEQVEGLLSKVEGGGRRRTAEPDELYGVNLSLRRDWVERVGPFRTDLGRVGNSLAGDEDVDLLERIVRAGGRLVYEPGAVVGHRVAPGRLRRVWFWSRCYSGYLAATRRIDDRELTLRTLRRPTYLLARHAWGLLRASWRPGLHSPEWFYRSTRVVGLAGTCIGTAGRLCRRSRPRPAAAV